MQIAINKVLLIDALATGLNEEIGKREYAWLRVEDYNLNSASFQQAVVRAYPVKDATDPRIRLVITAPADQLDDAYFQLSFPTDIKEIKLDYTYATDTDTGSAPFVIQFSSGEFTVSDVNDFIAKFTPLVVEIQLSISQPNLGGGGG